MTTGIRTWACLGVLAATGAAEGAAERTDFASLAGALAANAERWRNAQAVDPTVEQRLRQTRVDASNVDELIAQLKVHRADPVNLYVLNRLTQPLLEADKETVAKALDPLKAIDGRYYVQFRRLPHHTEEQLKQYELPDYRRGTPVTVMMKQVAALEKVRDEKIRQERPVLLHNQQLHDLKTMLCRLMLRADDPEEDQALTVLLVQNEGMGRWFYAEIAGMIETEAPRMPKQRAEFFYKTLLPHGHRLRGEKKQYTRYHVANLSRTGNSLFAQGEDQPGDRLLKLVNALAKPAQMPQVKLPSAGGGQQEGGRGRD